MDAAVNHASQHEMLSLMTARIRDAKLHTPLVLDAVLRSEPLAQLPVRELANFELISIGADSDVFEALRLMAQHRVHRLVVLDGTQLPGLLDLLELVSFLGHRSQLVALEIAAAHSVAELKRAAERVDAMSTLLFESGLHVERIAHLVTAINARLFQQLWQLVASPELVANSCLLMWAVKAVASRSCVPTKTTH